MQNQCYVERKLQAFDLKDITYFNKRETDGAAGFESIILLSALRLEYVMHAFFCSNNVPNWRAVPVPKE